MYYLEQVLKEVMRHYPLVPLVFRTAQEDTTVGTKNEKSHKPRVTS